MNPGPTGTPSHQPPVFTIALLIFISALGLRLFHLDYRDAWMDELAQYSYTQKGTFNPSITTDAATQGQPPLDASLQTLGLLNFGTNETGLRCHAAGLGALSILFFFLLLNHLTHSLFPSTIATLFLTFHPWLIRYSQEGRPISTTITMSIIYLSILFFFLKKNQSPLHTAPPPPPLTSSLLILISFQTWFILSAGFQPLIFILTSCLALLPLLFSKTFRRPTLFILLSVPLSFLIAYPILKTSIDLNANLYLQTYSPLEKTLSIFNHLFSIPLHDYLDFFQPLTHYFHWLFLLTLIPGIIGLIDTIRHKTMNITSAAFIYFLIFVPTFPLLFYSTFTTLIKTKIKTRYFLSFTPALAALLALSLFFTLHAFLPVIKNKIKTHRAKLWNISTLTYTIITFLFILAFFSNWGKLEDLYKSKNREWNKVYELFSNYSTPHDQAYVMNLSPPGQWAPLSFPNKEFYLNKTNSYPITIALKDQNALASDYPGFLNPNFQGNIFIVFIYGEEKLKPSLFKNLPFIRFYPFYRLPVIQVLNQGQLPQHLTQLFLHLCDHLPIHPSNYLAFQVLFYLHTFNHNFERAGQLLNTLEKMNGNGKLSIPINLMKQYLDEQLNQTQPITK